MVCEKWNEKPSEMINLNEDPFTEYCFNEAVSYALALHRKKANENDNNSSSRREKVQDNSALDFMAKDKYKK